MNSASQRVKVSWRLGIEALKYRSSAVIRYNNLSRLQSSIQLSAIESPTVIICIHDYRLSKLLPQ